MRELVKNGYIEAYRLPENADDIYRACVVPFFPGKNYLGLAEHERHMSRMYHFVPGVGLFSDRAGAARGEQEQDNKESIVRHGVRNAAQAIYDWCKKTHNHPLMPGWTPRHNKEQLEALTPADILSYVSPVAPDPPLKRLRLAPPDTPPSCSRPVVEITRLVRSASTTEIPALGLRSAGDVSPTAPSTVVGALSCETKPFVAAAKPHNNKNNKNNKKNRAGSQRRTAKNAVVSSTGASSQVNPHGVDLSFWYALSDGQLFSASEWKECQAAYAEAKETVRLRIFRTLREAAQWHHDLQKL
ncbi:hypothetical protein C8R43DRAFT_1143262 [Mycena crocata]|nr:hypothetical protein C8R43DRAFT_1143262 [Mycena crocata]